jgi:hypothetical protein
MKTYLVQSGALHRGDIPSVESLMSLEIRVVELLLVSRLQILIEVVEVNSLISVAQLHVRTRFGSSFEIVMNLKKDRQEENRDR